MKKFLVITEKYMPGDTENPCGVKIEKAKSLVELMIQEFGWDKGDPENPKTDKGILDLMSEANGDGMDFYQVYKMLKDDKLKRVF